MTGRQSPWVMENYEMTSSGTSRVVIIFGSHGVVLPEDVAALHALIGKRVKFVDDGEEKF